MNVRIENVPPKKLVGVNRNMSLIENTTHLLFQSFMPRRHEITNPVDGNIICMQVYGPGHFTNFNPATRFEKWAAVEVSDNTTLAADMEAYTIGGGLYAIFHHVGGPATAETTFRYILGEWMPQSGYELDDREHFEVLGPKYHRDDPNSEEDIYIPIRKR